MNAEIFPEPSFDKESRTENAPIEGELAQSRLPAPLFDLRSWDQLSPAECEEVARLVAERIPTTFHFEQIETYQCSSQQHHIALFKWKPPHRRMEREMQQNTAQVEAATSQQSGLLRRHPNLPTWNPLLTSNEPVLFALIPGNRATLGYDLRQPFTPEDKHLWGWLMNSFLLGEDTLTLDGTLLRDLTDTLIPDYDEWYTYLEQVMTPLRAVPIQPFLLEVSAKDAGKLLPSPRRMYKKYSILGKRRLVPCGRYPHFVSYSELVLLLKVQGFRLPTADEWEYARAAGTRSLFYWGESLWSGYRSQHNAFGLFIENDSYKWEFCAEAGMMRGGDGGVAVCGGEGALAECITAASAYYHLLKEPNSQTGGYFRRAYSLPL
jgi:hypothetical protein